MFSERYSFGPFELDPRAFRLARDGEIVPMQPKGLELLIRLVRSAGELVSRESIQEALWPDVIVTEQSLRQVVRRMRAALGDTYGDLIETVPRRGLRFVGAAHSLAEVQPAELLPVERDPFVGRVEEQRLLDGMRTDGVRLLTVLGPGGVGKTRLVVHHARSLSADGRGGVWFCDLSGARDEGGIVRAVAGALGIPLVEADPVVRLGRAVAGQGECTFILDNFEQVSGHAGSTLGRWLDAAPRARFVVTSRHRLGLAGEQVLLLAPLNRTDAEQLFVLRALAAGRADPMDEPQAVGALVDLLDRLPLAIELAAARAALLTPSKISERLGDRFALLGTGTGTERRAPLRAAFDWSWELLEGWEQCALAQLAVFHGGFTVEAAEGVLALSDEPRVPPVLDVLHALVDKSLVRSTTGSRFDLLVTVRAYARERLAAQGGVEAAEARHGAYFSEVDTSPSEDPFEEVIALRNRTVELGNLVAATRRAIARGDGDMSARTALAAGRVLALVGPFALDAELSEAALAVPGVDSYLCARLHNMAGFARLMQGRLEHSMVHQEAALARSRALGKRIFESIVTGQVGRLNEMQGRTEQARAAHARALEIAREAGNPVCEAIALSLVAGMDADAGRVEDARVGFELASRRLWLAGDRRLPHIVFSNLAVMCRLLGRVAEARRYATRSLVTSREVGDRRSEGVAIGDLGQLDDAQGRTAQARSRYDAALAIHREVGDRRMECRVLDHLGNHHVREGRFDEAMEAHQAALIIADEMADRKLRARVRASVAGWQHACGRGAEAALVLSEALAEAQQIGNRLLEGPASCLLARIHLEEGDLGLARSALDSGEQMLRDGGLVDELGLALCTRALLERQGGDGDGRAALAEAATLAARFDAGPRSALGARLADVRHRVGFSGG